MSWEFMEAVRTEKAYLPKVTEIKLVNVPSPPKQSDLVKIVAEELEKSAASQ